MKFVKRNLILTLALLIGLCLFVTLGSPKAEAIQSGWYQWGNRWRYYDEYGKLHTGWLQYGGNLYYFHSDGTMNTRSPLRIDGEMHLFNKDGTWDKQLKNCWYEGDINDGYHLSNWYYYDENGKSHSGWLKYGDNWFHFNEDYGMTTGKFYQGKTVHYFDENGFWIRSDTDRWVQINGKWFYYSAKKETYLTNTEHEIDGKWYCFDQYGAMRTGWYGNSYYNASGEKVFGWLFYEGKWYYLDWEGETVSGLYMIDKKAYVFDLDGVWLDVTGWVEIPHRSDLDKKYIQWCYIHSDRELHRGWLQYGNNWYYLNKDSGRLVKYRTVIDDVLHDFDENGVWQGPATTGWQQEGGKWYYYDRYSGEMYVSKWVLINNEYYYFDNNGVMQTGWIKAYGKWYYLSDTGALHTGWLQYGDNRYYMRPEYDGEMAIGPVLIDNNIYLFKADGVMHTGWYEEYGTYYYFDPSGAMHFGWLELNGKWYAFDEYGQMIVGWGSDTEHIYYFNDDGTMVTGWKTIDGKAYHFDKDGHCTNY